MNMQIIPPTFPSETKERFVDAMAALANGVSIVTTNGAGGKFGLTVSAITSVSAEPPILLACLNRKNIAVSAINRNHRFAVNILNVQSQQIAQAFAGRALDGKHYDFEQLGWTEGQALGLPILEFATASFECELESFHDAGTHRIFIGRVISALRGDAEPMVYSNRSYGRMIKT
jgi:flavin reductase (DIM6/NTAB) family NADH-FMN oxidoreductase RutF